VEKDAGSSHTKKRLKLRFFVIKSPLGELGVVECRKGIVALLRGEGSSLRGKIHSRFPSSVEERGFYRKRMSIYIDRYFSQKPISPPPLTPVLSPFQRKVLNQVRKIPFGSVRTYGWIARKIESPRAGRACGRALHKNPIPLLIPCHRVVSASGDPGGFLWGRKVKEKLLLLERRGGVLKK